MNSRHTRSRVRWHAALLLLLIAAMFAPPASAQNPPRYFSQTGHYLRGAFRSFWERNGGLAIFGYPITEEYVRRADGKIVQYFERARFELTVRNNQAVIDLGRLGVEATGNKIFPQVAPFPSSRERLYIAETSHSLFGGFKTFWQRRGGASIFGLPISEEIVERFGDGRWRTVQYFERARFEWWPDGVRLTQLGRQLAPQQLLEPWPANSPPSGPLSEDGTPRPPRAPTPTPAPAGRAAVRVAPAAASPGQSLAVQGEGFAGGEQVSLWLTAPDQSVRAIEARPTADAGGAISAAGVRVATDGFGSGRWFITGQGLSSGRRAIGEFRIAPPPGDASKLGILLQDTLVPSGPGAIVPLAAAPGSAFTFSASGYDPAERVGVWLTRPGGAGLEEIDQRLVQPDGRGGITVVFGTQSQAEGVWLISGQGVNTGRAVTVPFKVTRDYVAPPGTPRPASRNGAVTPAEGGQRAVFRLTGSGFRANERLTHWITSPDGVYYLAAPLDADGRGRIGFASGLLVQLGARNPPGVYGYHYRGTRSGVRVDLYLTYTGAP